MSGLQNKIRHHYVPIGLSKNFCLEEKRLYLYDILDKKIIPSSPKDAFLQKNLHTLVKEGGELDHNLVENEFMEIEGHGAKAINEIIHGEIISGNRKSHLATLVALQHLRTPTARKAIEAVLKESIIATAKVLDAGGKIGEVPEALKPFGGSLSELLDKGHVLPEIILPQVTMSGLSALPDVHSLLVKMNWSVLQAPDGYYFFLADHPCAILNPDFKTKGLGLASSWDAELTMPISKNLCLLASLKNIPPKVMLMPAAVRNINSRSAVFGERFFAYPTQSKEMLDFLMPYKHCNVEARFDRLPVKGGQMMLSQSVITGSKKDLYEKIQLLF